MKKAEPSIFVWCSYAPSYGAWCNTGVGVTAVVISPLSPGWVIGIIVMEKRM